MTFGRQSLAAICQLMTVIIIARVLGAEGNGQYAMAILLPTMLVSFLNLGVGPATVYYVGRKETTATDAAKVNCKIALVIAFFGLIIALPVVVKFGETLFPNVPLELLILGILAFPLSLLHTYWSIVLQAKEDFVSFNTAVMVGPLVTLLSTTIALLVLNMDGRAAVASYVVGQVIALLAVWHFIRKIENQSPCQAQSALLQTRKLLGYGWKAHLSNIMAFVNYRADIFLVNFLIGPVATGVYVIAVQFAEKLWMLSRAASTVLLPRLSSMSDQPDLRYRLTVRASWVVSLITLIAACFLAVMLSILLEPVFGKEFNDAMMPFMCLMPGIIAGAGSRIQANCIAAAGKPEWNFYVAIIIVSINIAGNLVLIPIYGLSGAAVATTIAYVINSVLKFLLVKKLHDNQV